MPQRLLDISTAINDFLYKQLPQPSFAQAQTAKDAENHATPPQEQPQTQPEVQVQPQAEPLPAPPSHSEVIFFSF